MTSEDIYKLLQSKPHNPHYLNRYVKYLKLCEIKNSINTPTDIENHHICPKASDLFPQYESLRDFKWNKIKLTPYQHIWAHIILWKLYGGSQSQAIHYMFNVQHGQTNYKSHRKIPSFLNIRYAVKLKQQFYKSRKGFSTYKDSEGTKYFLHKDNPVIQEMGLVGYKMGSEMSDAAKENFRRAKDPYRIVHMYLNGTAERKSVPLLEVKQYEKLGWVYERSEESRLLAKENQKKIVSEKLTGIKRPGPRSEKQMLQAKEQQSKLAKDATIQAKKSLKIANLKWCYDPEVKQNRRLPVIPEGWKSGKFIG